MRARARARAPSCKLNRATALFLPVVVSNKTEREGSGEAETASISRWPLLVKRSKVVANVAHDRVRRVQCTLGESFPRVAPLYRAPGTFGRE